MKIRLSAVAMIVMAAASCTRELPDVITGEREKLSFTVDAYPAFEEDGTRSVGTYDAGKTEWTDGDEIFVRIETAGGETKGITLENSGGSWTGTQTEIPVSDVVSVTAVYSPVMQMDASGNMTLKSGMQKWQGEYMSVQGVNASGNVQIDFTSASRDYSRLRIASDPGNTVDVKISGFSSPGEKGSTSDLTASGLIADSKGNAYIYGSWKSGSSLEVTVSGSAKSFTLKESVPGRSYAVDAAGERVPGKFKVTFDLNGGTGVDQLVYWASPGESVELPKTAVREGYMLKGWYNQTLNVMFDYSSSGTSSVMVSDKDFYIVFIWEEITTEGATKYRNEDVWVKGIVPPSEDDWELASFAGDGYLVRWKPGLGWYNTNQNGLDMCWAATASNILHWWLDQNRTYVDRFIEQTGRDIPRTFHEAHNSDIFNNFVDHWPNAGNGTHIGFGWFLTGSDKIGGGAYFKEVFNGSVPVSDFMVSWALQRKDLNRMLEEAFEKGCAISIGINAMNGGAPHALTVWGAHFDDEGFADILYITNSATFITTRPPEQPAGIVKAVIGYTSNLETLMEGSTGKLSQRLYWITYYGLGQDKWEKYFSSSPGVASGE